MKHVYCANVSVTNSTSDSLALNVDCFYFCSKNVNPEFQPSRAFLYNCLFSARKWPWIFFFFWALCWPVARSDNPWKRRSSKDEIWDIFGRKYSEVFSLGLNAYGQSNIAFWTFISWKVIFGTFFLEITINIAKVLPFLVRYLNSYASGKILRGEKSFPDLDQFQVFSCPLHHTTFFHLKLISRAKSGSAI